MSELLEIQNSKNNSSPFDIEISIHLDGLIETYFFGSDKSIIYGNEILNVFEFKKIEEYLPWVINPVLGFIIGVSLDKTIMKRLETL